MLMRAGALMPVTVTTLDVMGELLATSVCATKLKGSGVVSANAVITEKPRLTSPMVKMAWVRVAKVDAAVTRSCTLSLLLTVPGVLTKAPPLMAY